MYEYRRFTYEDRLHEQAKVTARAWSSHSLIPNSFKVVFAWVALICSALFMAYLLSSDIILFLIITVMGILGIRDHNRNKIDWSDYE